MASVVLRFVKGTITVFGDYHVPNTSWDQRTNCYRAPAIHYRDAVNYLRSSEIEYEDQVLDLIPCPDFSCDLRLRNYQKEALARWMIGKKGVIVLPTGSGKTFIALGAIRALNCSTLVVVPTLDLVHQWKRQLKRFGVEIGEYTGNRRALRALTVSTYDSAYLNAENIGNKFKLLIFDEVHHLCSEGYRHIAEFFASPYRMGLTATYERPDSLHRELPRLVGGKIYERKTRELAGTYLSSYRLERIPVDLTPEEREKYEMYEHIFRSFVRSRNIRFSNSADFRKIVMLSGRDPEAWEAVLARNEARKIAYNSKQKMELLGTLLEQHRGDRVIIFTRYNDLVYRISDEFLVPCITHKTDIEERREVLDNFRSGAYSAIVSSQVLDEGIDVPDANIGIIVSGTGSSREFIQRLGRILRPKKEVAVLYEIVSRGTAEVATSRRRRRKVS